jgi:hypothetical protein
MREPRGSASRQQVSPVAAPDVASDQAGPAGHAHGALTFQEEIMRKLAAVLLAVGVTSMSAASAHTPFIKPTAFLPAAGSVHAEAAYSTDIFTPVIGFPAVGLSIIAPDGRDLGYSEVRAQPTFTELEANLPQAGTYRLTTGEQYGPVTPMVLDNR